MTITINGIPFPFYNQVSINLSYDSIADTFSYKLYFEPENAQHKQALRPLSYLTCRIYHGGVLVMTGTLLNHKFSSAGDPPKEWVTVEGYSLSGILGDCNLAYFQQSFPDQVPAQFNGLTLFQIASKLCAAYNLKAYLSEDLQNDVVFNTPYPSCTNDDDSNSVADFLNKLCTAKNAVLSHTNEGNILITRANVNKIKTTTKTYLREGEESTNTLNVYNDPGNVSQSQTVSIKDRKTLYDFAPGGQVSWFNESLDINGQNIHTYIHVTGQAKDPTTSGESDGEPSNALDDAVTNFLVNIPSGQTLNLPGTMTLPGFPNLTQTNTKTFQSWLRYRFEKQTSGDDNDTPQTARAFLGDELKNIVLTFSVQGWSLNGNLITPNQLISVVAPELYIYKKTVWFVTNVAFFGDEKKEYSTLTCVLVECFNNDTIDASTKLSNQYPIF